MFEVLLTKTFAALSCIFMHIKEAKYIISSPSVDKCPKPDKREYAFIGRSNVGKSSLINMLTGKRELAKVSANPGKTQMINHFEITSGKNSKWYLVDLPGSKAKERLAKNDRRLYTAKRKPYESLCSCR
jgi:GTP-binding protein